MAEPTYTIGSFILTRGSRHPEVAVDFMRFLTSRDMAAVFTRESSWLPAVRGVALPPFTKLFMPDTRGFPAGFDTNFGWIGAETRRVVATDLFALLGPQGSVAKFQRTMDRNFPAAVAADLALLAKTRLQTAARADSVLGALLWQEDRAAPADRAALDAKIRQVSESQTGQETDAYWIRARLTQLGYALPR
jgi:ABC-type glycerol-3-phosphate transport system substrate-binding protein